MATYPVTHDDDAHVHHTGLAPQAKSMASILAILASIGSFMVDNAAGKFALVIAAVVLGLVGMVRATSPRVSGGILSLIAILIAVVGLIAAILDTLGVF